MFDTLLNLLTRPEIDDSIKVPIVDNLFSFLSDVKHLELAQAWLESGVITLEGKEVFKLSTKHKYSIMVRIFEEPSVSGEVKANLLEKTLGDDKSDMAQNIRETCTAILPKEDVKASIWQQITDVTSTDSIYKREAKM